MVWLVSSEFLRDRVARACLGLVKKPGDSYDGGAKGVSQ